MKLSRYQRFKLVLPQLSEGTSFNVHLPFIALTNPTENLEEFAERNEIIQLPNQSSFDVETFADEMNLWGVQLRRKLKAITNQTVTEFVRNYRLAVADEKLKNNSGTVSEIAYKVGFENMPYFSKVFLEEYGKMPSE